MMQTQALFMMSANTCARCGALNLRRSRIRNVFEWLVAFVLIPYRCRLCDFRELKIRFMDMHPGGERHHTDGGAA